MGWSATRAAEIFAEFRAHRGSLWIATGYALEGLLDEVDRCKPRYVLELGPGIGATTRALIDGLDRTVGPRGWRVTSVEESEFCRGALAANLGADFERIDVVSDVAEIPDDVVYDLVLIDGPGSLLGHEDRVGPRAVIFVENLRRSQRAELELILPKPWSLRSSWPVLTTERLGGYHVYQLNPTRAERASFGLRHRGQSLAVRVRPWVRRGLVKVGLVRVVEHCSRRADRGQISGAERLDPRVAFDGGGSEETAAH